MLANAHDPSTWDVSLPSLCRTVGLDTSLSLPLPHTWPRWSSCSCQIDFLLTALRGLAARRPDIKIVLMSATANTEEYEQYFADAGDETRVEQAAYAQGQLAANH